LTGVASRPINRETHDLKESAAFAARRYLARRMPSALSTSGRAPRETQVRSQGGDDEAHGSGGIGIGRSRTGWVRRRSSRRIDATRRRAVEEMKAVALGWSVKKQTMGQSVYNEQNQRVGKIDDLIIAPDTAVSFVIVGAGGFVGLGRHDVAVPVSQLKQQDGKFVLPGATKEAIKALPKFEYARK
jgi:hypothetical protein